MYWTRWLLLPLALAAGPVPAESTDVSRQLEAMLAGELSLTELEVTYDDLHGLHGGLRLTIKGDGEVEQQAVRTEAGSPRRVDEDGVRALAELLLELEAWRQDEEERTLLPDESQARLKIRAGSAESEIWEWFDDLEETDRMIRVREKMKELAWEPEPENATAEKRRTP